MIEVGACPLLNDTLLQLLDVMLLCWWWWHGGGGGGWVVAGGGGFHDYQEKHVVLSGSQWKIRKCRIL